MDKIKKNLKKSYFVVNKIYLFLIFISLSLIDFTLGFYYFVLSLIIYIFKIMTSRLPLEPNKKYNYETYTYKESDKRSLKIDIWYPLEKQNINYPLVFFAHGGGWISGFRNQANNVSWCKYLASKGFCVSSIDYRYGFKNNMEDILSDYTDALNFIKENSEKLNIDKNNIVLMGLSAGGHLALLYSTHNTFIENNENMEGIKGVIAYYSPSDLNDIFITDNKSIFARFATKKTLNGDPLDKKDIYDYYSPINWVSEKMVPCLVAHGKLDTTVPFKSSVNLIRKLKHYNIKCDFLVHKKGKHSFDTQLNDLTTVNIIEKTARFAKKMTK
ncbi:alpha/beta hydrolase [Anaerosalibacter sp. Marseille-P3206]|uniref:alpha/beta hydrolase n=1 Tax=Anaerosalibacter sp. Marseille-P3206 TaxID=1871005 RepID=UPI00190EFF17|nr:alpha/beta hydrolase [Anaerosalibacter sp. Marseille-P3206]